MVPKTGGRFAAFDVLLPAGCAAPPLHSHPQDERFYVLDGELTVWLVEAELAADTGTPPAWVASRAQGCGRGEITFAPAGTPHTFRVESDTALMAHAEHAGRDRESLPRAGRAGAVDRGCRRRRMGRAWRRS